VGALQAELAEGRRGAARRDAGVAAFLLLAVLGACRLQHRLFLFLAALVLDDLLRLLHRGLRGGSLLVALRPRPRGAALRARAGHRRGDTRAGGRGRLRLALGYHLALVDPDLDADHAVVGLGFARAVVDVG